MSKVDKGLLKKEIKRKKEAIGETIYKQSKGPKNKKSCQND